MISFDVIMFAEVRQGATQRGFTEENKLGKTFALDRAYPSLRKGIQIRAACRERHSAYTASCESIAEVRAELLVAIVQHVAASFRITRILQRCVASHLLHPARVRMSVNPADPCPTALQFDKEQNVVRHQASPGQHLNREEIGSSEHVHMPADELLPSGRLTPIWRRCDVVAAKDVTEGLVREPMAQVGRRADDAVVTPARVLASDTDDQRFHLGCHPGSARIGTVFGTIELAGDEAPIPIENGVRLGCAGHLFQPFASQTFPDLGQRAPLRIGEPESGRKVCSQDAILGGQVLILEQQLLIDEARHKGQKACPMGGVVHVEGSS